MLEGGDEFTGGGIEGQIFNGVTDGKHGLVIKNVIDVRRGKMGAMMRGGGAGLFGDAHSAVVGGFKVRLETGPKTAAGSSFLCGFTDHG